MHFCNKLIDHCEKNNIPMEITRDPDKDEELWEIKIYPFGWDEGHYYAAYETLEKAANRIMIEMGIA